ncbi:MAG TPA: 2-octaprenyl-6-methoxyphenyl hydroxylase [Oceanospirillaceae bacterium]|nr:2-octaprenyl-6-methoxyphenyl hydroxylase [Oceanospirillaceae bacterium]
MTVNQGYDIVIVGGGLVGASLCLAVAGIAQTYGLKIAILDSAKIEGTTPTAGGVLDGRATALAYGSRNLLHSIGLWQHLSEHAQAISNIQVSDQGQPWKSDMQASSMQREALGYVIQNQALGHVFLQQIQQRCSGFVDLIDQAQVVSIDNARQHSQLIYQRQTAGDTAPPITLTAELIVMADGGRSQLRQQLGMFDRVHSYDQVALVANLELEQPHQGLACERFTASGPVALLPLIDHMSDPGSRHRVALVWTQPLARQQQLEQMSDAELLQEIQQQVGYPMGELRAIGDRQVYPLSMSVAQEQARQGMAVIGNAAHTLHPIAGQGFNLALRGSFALAETVLRACKSGLPLGDLANLNQFVEASQWDQNRVIGASDKVMKLFSSRKPHYSIVRQLGLLTMQQVPLVKTVFTRAAMGLDVPLAQVLPMPAPTVATERVT